MRRHLAAEKLRLEVVIKLGYQVCETHWASHIGGREEMCSVKMYVLTRFYADWARCPLTVEKKEEFLALIKTLHPTNSNPCWKVVFEAVETFVNGLVKLSKKNYFGELLEGDCFAETRKR